VSDDETRQVREAVIAAVSGVERLVLAVSGGIDSMTLLDAACAVVARDRVTVATFDHGTGPSAAEAVAVVREESARRDVECISAKATTTLVGEAALRRARWEFLRAVARERNAAVCTGHTEDEQVETVLMRFMRDAGPRGLAGLYASSDVLRPLLTLRRRTVAAYATRVGLRWVDDPSNQTDAYHRNRLRRDLLPALRSVDPSIDLALLDIAQQAARWRRDVDQLCDGIEGVRRIDGGRGLTVPVKTFVAPIDDSARLVWPELAARAGAVLDRRGIDRLARFAVNSRVGARVQLSGGWEVVRARNSFGLRQVPARKATPEASALSDGTRFGFWTFRAEAPATLTSPRDSWSSWLPTHVPLVVRPWHPGDAMIVGTPGSRRKVKHLLSAAGVTGHERAGWPVVVSGDDIVWIPGVRRTDAAAARSGRPGLAFVCEYDHR
jgi:tRNA(Ile)-lysidine synthase